MRKREHERTMEYYEMKAKPRKPLDASYFSTSDEESASDFEVEDKDLYPRKR